MNKTGPKLTPLFLEDIENLLEKGCGNPECTHGSHNVLLIHSICHPDKPIEAIFVKNAGFVVVRCGECENPIVAIWIQRRPRQKASRIIELP